MRSPTGPDPTCEPDPERDATATERTGGLSNPLLHPGLPADARVLLRAVRNHWREPSGYENALHWILDIVFQEDESHIRTAMPSCRSRTVWASTSCTARSRPRATSPTSASSPVGTTATCSRSCQIRMRLPWEANTTSRAARRPHESCNRDTSTDTRLSLWPAWPPEPG